MKRTIATLLSMALLLCLGGCSTAQDGQSATDGAGSALENERTLEGKVTRVDGNELTIDVGTLEQNTKNIPGEMGVSDSGNPPDGTASLPSMEGRGNGGSRPSGEGEMPGGRGSGASGGFSPDGQSGTMPMMGGTSITLTGESKTVTIPVGTPVYITVRGASSTSNFTRISKDNLVRIVLSEEDTVLSVTVVSE